MAMDTCHPSMYSPVYCGIGVPPIQRWSLFLHLLNLGSAMCLALARGTLANLCTMTCPLATFGNIYLLSREQAPNSLQDDETHGSVTSFALADTQLFARHGSEAIHC